MSREVDLGPVGSSFLDEDLTLHVPEIPGATLLHQATALGPSMLATSALKAVLAAAPRVAGLEDNLGRLPLHLAIEAGWGEEAIEALLAANPAAASAMMATDGSFVAVRRHGARQPFSRLPLNRCEGACWGTRRRSSPRTRGAPAAELPPLLARAQATSPAMCSGRATKGWATIATPSLDLSRSCHCK